MTTKHTESLAALTERIAERVRGFEICDLNETDQNSNLVLVGMAKTYEDALLWATSPELLSEARRCENFLSSLTSLTSEQAEWQNGLLRGLRAAIAKAEGKS